MRNWQGRRRPMPSQANARTAALQALQVFTPTSSTAGTAIRVVAQSMKRTLCT